MKKIITLSLALMSVTSFASESLSNQLRVCQAEKDSLKRLLCYDAIADTLPTQQVKSVVEAPKKLSTTAPNVVKEDLAIDNKVARDNTVESAVNQQANNNTKPSAETRFGNEYKPDPKKASVDEVVYVIKTAKKSLRQTWKFEFENGQRWEQKDSSYAKFKTGDKVQIKRGVLSSFYLKKVGTNRTIRVTRID